ncbi:RNA polymerase sigma factor [Emticicia sp. BO119]|uniref:RNA polymerase sigma factor n=1 Tax=Emticicia sp. BO119 TaxID=2757768 RepID=UPI0015F124F4|nr:sigma-70 family RNA polymerase sigma factor [Emticicia sp. BO119]MBA4852444.1 sigma-70 family RNA polymerase sigma factor [Emticicia sp. BO119]
MNDEQKDITLLKRIQAGDRLAYKELINRYKDYAFTVAFRILNSREDAEEIAQDAFLQVYRNVNTFNFEAKFTTWFYRIVFNAALMQKRKNRIFTEDIDTSTQASIVSNMSDSSEEIRRNERQNAIRLAMQRLQGDDVLLITLFYLKEQSLEEIAAITQISAETAKVKIHRARKRLAEEMKKHWKEEVRSLI